MTDTNPTQTDPTPRTLKEIDREYSYHAMQYGDKFFKKEILETELYTHYSKMKQLNEEAKTLKTDTTETSTPAA